MNGYRTQFASSVGHRDGVQVELLSPSGEYLAEVFRDDETGARVFNTLTNKLAVAPEVLSWFLQVADE